MPSTGEFSRVKLEWNILSSLDGHQVKDRLDWASETATGVSDEAVEARPEPALWGTLRFEGNVDDILGLWSGRGGARLTSRAAVRSLAPHERSIPRDAGAGIRRDTGVCGMIGRLLENLRRTDLRRRMAGNAGWLLLERAVRLPVGILVSVWLARYLGPSAFGRFNYVLAFSTIFLPLFMLGLNGIVIRDLVRHPAQRPAILGSAFVLKACGGCAGLACAMGAMALLHPQDANLRVLVFIAGAGMLFMAFDVVDFWFQSQLAARNIVIARLVACVAVAVAKVVAILLQAPLATFVVIHAGEAVLIAGGLVVTYRVARGHFAEWRFQGETARRLLCESWPLALSSVAILLNMRLDQVMLRAMRGEEAVGLYAAAVRISEAWYFVPFAIVGTAFPVVVALKTRDPDRYRLRLQQLFSLLVAVSYAVAIPMTFVAPWLVTRLYGASYAAAGAVLSLHIWAGLFVALSAGRGSWIVSEG
jgi:polysaccharide transporter, PST family